jgi:hypothetical protein
MPFTVEQAGPLYIRLHADAPTSQIQRRGGVIDASVRMWAVPART